jgi:hypothetical protein
LALLPTIESQLYPPALKERLSFTMTRAPAGHEPATQRLWDGKNSIKHAVREKRVWEKKYVVDLLPGIQRRYSSLVTRLRPDFRLCGSRVAGRMTGRL